MVHQTRYIYMEGIGYYLQYINVYYDHVDEKIEDTLESGSIQ